MLDIRANGSRWAGQEPASIEELLDLLNREPLDAGFEKYGNFIRVNPCEGIPNPEHKFYGDGQPALIDGKPLFDNPATVCFWGNFRRVSHVFNIFTDEPETIAQLTAAIRENQKRPDYTERRTRP